MTDISVANIAADGHIYAESCAGMQLASIEAAGRIALYSCTQVLLSSFAANHLVLSGTTESVIGPGM